MIMKNCMDTISKSTINHYLDSDFFDIEVKDVVTSTSTILKDTYNDKSKEGKVLIARKQTAGRGRMGRVFYSPKESGIYMSILLKPRANLNLLTSLTGVAVANAINSLSCKKAQIKWVNDIMIDGKKCAGILAEGIVKDGKIDAVVIGIGINAYQPKKGFNSAIKDIATCVFDEKVKNGRAKLIGAILENLHSYYIALDEEKIASEYRALSCIIGKQVIVSKWATEQVARVIDISSDCHLVVEYDNGEIESLSYGEVKVSL